MKSQSGFHPRKSCWNFCYVWRTVYKFWDQMLIWSDRWFFTTDGRLVAVKFVTQILVSSLCSSVGFNMARTGSLLGQVIMKMAGEAAWTSAIPVLALDSYSCNGWVWIVRVAWKECQFQFCNAQISIPFKFWQKRSYKLIVFYPNYKEDSHQTILSFKFNEEFTCYSDLLHLFIKFSILIQVCNCSQACIRCEEA